MSTNKSQNLKLHLWEPEDDFLCSEFNENFAVLDSAVKADRDAIQSEAAARQKAIDAEAAAREAADAAEAQARETVRTLANAANLAANKAQQTADAAWSATNPGWVVGSYVGDGTTPTVLKLGFCPSFVYVAPAAGNYSALMLYPRNYTSFTSSNHVTWLSDGVSWESDSLENQLNVRNRTYYYIAFR